VPVSRAGAITTLVRGSAARCRPRQTARRLQVRPVRYQPVTIAYDGFDAVGMDD
jgi:hypothetical protein